MNIYELISNLYLDEKISSEEHKSLLTALKLAVTPVKVDNSPRIGMYINTLDLVKLEEAAIRLAYQENPGASDKKVSKILNINVRTLYRRKAEMNLKTR